MIKNKKAFQREGPKACGDKTYLPESQDINPGVKTFTVSIQQHCRIIWSSEGGEFFILHLSKGKYLLLISCPCFTTICGMCICVSMRKITFHFSPKFTGSE